MKIKKLVAAVLAVATVASFAAMGVACNSGNNGDGGTTENGDGGTTETETKKYTVTWYNGDTVLKTTEVKEGGYAGSWTPAVKGYTFGGIWYADKACTKVFDFSKEITADTSVYSTWTEMVYSCSGGGVGSLKENSWTPSNYSLKCSVDESNTTYSVAYTITLTMYADDAFRFTLNGDWDNNDAGIGYVKGFVQDEETDANGNKTGTVKEGEDVIFKGTQEFGKSAEHWNITCVKSGIYKFVLGLDENSLPKAIEYTRTGDAPEITETHDMYLIGSFNSWTTGDANYRMTANSDKSVWTGYLSVTDDMTKGESGKVELKVFNKVNTGYYAVTSDNIQLETGDYYISYNTSDNSVTYEKCEYYVVGTFEGANFSVKIGTTPVMNKNDNGTYSAEITISDVSGSSDYSWLAQQSKGVMAVKCVYGTSLSVKDWYTEASDTIGDNYYFQTADVGKTYVITLTIGSGETKTTFTVAEKTAN